MSQPATGASAVQHARDRALGLVTCQPPAASDVNAPAHVPPQAAPALLHPLDEFWPCAYDAGALVAWVEELVSWRNPAHSRHALLLLLYGMYVMKRLMQQVSFAPMSVVSTVALAAVVRHCMATTLPTIRKQARTFQQQAQVWHHASMHHSRHIWPGCSSACRLSGNPGEAALMPYQVSQAQSWWTKVDPFYAAVHCVTFKPS